MRLKQFHNFTSQELSTSKIRWLFIFSNAYFSCDRTVLSYFVWGFLHSKLVCDQNSFWQFFKVLSSFLATGTQRGWSLGLSSFLATDTLFVCKFAAFLVRLFAFFFRVTGTLSGILKICVPTYEIRKGTQFFNQNLNLWSAIRLSWGWK